MQAVDFDICIVGGGMAGVSLACALQALPLRIALIESRSLSNEESLPDDVHTVDQVSYRVSAITAASKRFLQRIAVWPSDKALQACAFEQMSVWDGMGTGAIDFDAASVDAEALGYIVENRRLLNAMLAKLKEQSRVLLIDNIAVEGLALPQQDTPVTQLQLSDGRKLTTRLLVAADGARSPLRAMADFTTREWDYEQQAVVATVQTGKPHCAKAQQIFLSDGPLAFLPLYATNEHQQLSSIVWSCSPARADALMSMSNNDFAHALSLAFEYRCGDIEAVGERACFPLRQCHATDYVKEGIALVADAAHSIHPLAGQGINLGFADIEVLSDEIARALQAGRAFSDLTVLQRYQRRRKADNLRMMAVVEGFKRLYGEAPLPLQLLRNVGMRWVDRIEPLKESLIKQAMGI